MNKLNVIVPTTGQRLTQLKCCIESLKNQTEKVDITVVLGTKNPLTKIDVENLCDKYTRCNLFLEPEKKVSGSKRAVACNYGITKTKSEFIGFVDDDVVVPENWAEVLLKNFKEKKVVGVTSGCVLDDSVYLKVQTIGSDAHAKTFTEIDEVESIPGYNAIYRREVVESIGSFNEEIGGCEDWELNYRLRGAGCKLLGIPDAPVIHRHEYTQQGFINQMIGYGFSRSRLLKTRQIFTPIHALPAFAMVITPFLIYYDINLFISLLILYIMALFAMSLHVGTTGINNFLSTLKTFLIMHISWGYGYIKGLLK